MKKIMILHHAERQPQDRAMKGERMSYTIGGLARKVIGLGEQTEPADRRVDGVVGVTYVEKFDDGTFIVELADGSQWSLPSEYNASKQIDIDDIYESLKRRMRIKLQKQG